MYSVNLARILSESLVLLKSEPKLFIPRLLTTALYSLATLCIASFSAQALNRAIPAETFLTQSLLIFSAMPLLYLLDVTVYAMYPVMVSDRAASKKLSLKRALSTALKSYKTLAAFAFAVFAYALAVSAIAAPMLVHFMREGDILMASILALLVFAALIAFSTLMFFVVPSATISGKGIAASFWESMSLGLKHKFDIIKLNLFFALLAAATMYLVFSSELSGKPDFIALSSFVLLRLMQALIYTYLSVVNPNAYLGLRT